MHPTVTLHQFIICTCKTTAVFHKMDLFKLDQFMNNFVNEMKSDLCSFKPSELIHTYAKAVTLQKDSIIYHCSPLKKIYLINPRYFIVLHRVPHTERDKGIYQCILPELEEEIWIQKILWDLMVTVNVKRTEINRSLQTNSKKSLYVQEWTE